MPYCPGYKIFFKRRNMKKRKRRNMDFPAGNRNRNRIGIHLPMQGTQV